ncbi:MAG: hypothetical protein PVJ65_07660, partial [Chromatiales bacterium]
KSGCKEKSGKKESHKEKGNQKGSGKEKSGCKEEGCEEKSREEKGSKIAALYRHDRLVFERREIAGCSGAPQITS